MTEKNNWQLKLILLTGFAVLVFAVIYTIFFSYIKWQLSIQAKTEITSLELEQEQKWLLGQAELCATTFDMEPSVKNQTQSACMGRWRTFFNSYTDDESFLILRASTQNPINVTIESESHGLFVMSVRSKTNQSLGILTSLDTNQDLALPAALNIYWQTLATEDNTVVLPFVGSVILGRDVSIGSSKLLDSGKISLFSASEETLTGRALAEEIDLMLGDQVVLRSESGSSEPAPRGFILFNTLRPQADKSKLMDVVVHSPASRLIIQRYGEGGFGFQPGWWAKVKHRSNLVIGIVLLTGLLSLLNSLFDLYGRLSLLIPRKSKKDEDRTQL